MGQVQQGAPVPGFTTGLVVLYGQDGGDLVLGGGVRARRELDQGLRGFRLLA